MVPITQFDRLMAEVSSGSEDAVWQLAETYTPYIIRAVRYSLSPRIRQKLDSQDIAQSLWASLLLRRADFTRLETPGQLIAYLARATRNKVYQKTRRLTTQKFDVGRETPLSFESESGAPEIPRLTPECALYSREPSPSSQASFRECWRRIMSSASDRDQQIVNLRYQGYTFDEISVKLGIHEQTARRAMHRLIQKIAE